MKCLIFSNRNFCQREMQAGSGSKIVFTCHGILVNEWQNWDQKKNPTLAFYLVLSKYSHIQRRLFFLKYWEKDAWATENIQIKFETANTLLQLSWEPHSLSVSCRSEFRDGQKKGRIGYSGITQSRCYGKLEVQYYSF